MAEFFNQRLLTGIVILLLLLSILCQIIIGIIYQNMIKETENMATTENKLLSQCKLKFAKCFELYEGVINTSVFVDKFLNRIRFGGISLSGFLHVSGQLMLLSVFVAGVGICKGIIEGDTIGSLLPYYVVSLFGLYLYFSVSSLVDAPGKKKMLKTNMIDYLENNMQGHLQHASKEEILSDDIENNFETDAKKEEISSEIATVSFGEAEELELEELLHEFLT